MDFLPTLWWALLSALWVAFIFWTLLFAFNFDVIFRFLTLRFWLGFRIVPLIRVQINKHLFHLLRKTLSYPLIFKSLCRLSSLFGLPDQHLLDKCNELIIRIIGKLPNLVLKRDHATLNVPPLPKDLMLFQVFVLFEIPVFPNIVLFHQLLHLVSLQEGEGVRTIFFLGETKRIRKVHELFHIAIACEDRLSKSQFSQNAAYAPYVNGIGIISSHDYFRSPVVSRLQVLVKLLPLEATRSKINDFDANFPFFLHDYVLWLQITVNNLLFPHELQRVQHLNGKQPDLILVKSIVIVANDQLEQISL